MQQTLRPSAHGDQNDQGWQSEMQKTRLTLDLTIFYIYTITHLIFGEYFALYSNNTTWILAFFLFLVTQIRCIWGLLAIERELMKREEEILLNRPLKRVNVGRTELSGLFIPSSPLRQTAGSLLMIPFPFTRWNSYISVLQCCVSAKIWSFEAKLLINSLYRNVEVSVWAVSYTWLNIYSLC